MVEAVHMVQEVEVMVGEGVDVHMVLEVVVVTRWVGEGSCK